MSAFDQDLILSLGPLAYLGAENDDLEDEEELEALGGANGSWDLDPKQEIKRITDKICKKITKTKSGTIKELKN